MRKVEFLYFMVELLTLGRDLLKLFISVEFFAIKLNKYLCFMNGIYIFAIFFCDCFRCC